FPLRSSEPRGNTNAHDSATCFNLSPLSLQRTFKPRGINSHFLKYYFKIYPRHIHRIPKAYPTLTPQVSQPNPTHFLYHRRR
ncbi:hypothetical protein GIB67_012350, partial [Kingdonia uniflora]